MAFDPLQLASTTTRPSRFSPFQCALRLSNLPPNVKPEHLTHILSHPPAHGTLSTRKRDPGVSL